jgi:Kef-type K+ transport system membrane component KefB
MNRRAPRAPWGAFPLSELTVALAGILAVVGILTWGSPDSAWAFLGTMTLACLAGLEVAAREHFAGRRQHTTLLAGAVAVGLTAVAILVRVPAIVTLPLATAAFVLCATRLQRSFTRRARRPAS